VLEVLVNNGRVADRIVDSNKTSEIREIIAESGYYGMQTFDASLLSLLRQGLVSRQDALEASSNPHDITLAMEQAGLKATA
jgi:twitching motility protein PilT